MSEARRSPWRPGRAWWLVPAVWTIPAAVATIVYYVTTRDSKNPVTWAQAFLAMAPFWYLWVLLTPPAVWLARRFPVGGPRTGRHVAYHATFAVLFSAIHLTVGLFLLRAFMPPAPETWAYSAVLVSFVRTYFEFDLMLYPLVVVVIHAYDYYVHGRRDALRAAELEVQLAHAHLQALRMQLQPHFLFNTLHAVSSLMDEDVKAARRMLARLSELLRLTLDTQGIHEVPLERELEVLELYLDIERLRFSDRMTVEFQVEPETLDAMVPNLILQPLVENAVRHGIAPRPGGGRITVSAARDGARVHLAVQDDGEGPPPGAPRPSGVGLGNTRQRLEELYGPDHDFAAGPADGGGFEVRVTVPYRAAGRAVEAGAA